jgi:hypothetical protein
MARPTALTLHVARCIDAYTKANPEIRNIDILVALETIRHYATEAMIKSDPKDYV